MGDVIYISSSDDEIQTKKRKVTKNVETCKYELQKMPAMIFPATSPASSCVHTCNAMQNRVFMFIPSHSGLFRVIPWVIPSYSESFRVIPGYSELFREWFQVIPSYSELFRVSPSHSELFRVSPSYSG